MFHYILLAIFFITTTSLTACSGVNILHGYNFNDTTPPLQMVEMINGGDTIKNAKTNTMKTETSGDGKIATVYDVLQRFGTPTIVSDFGEPTFFYAQRIVTKMPLSIYELYQQDVVAITFHDNGKINNARIYTKDDAGNEFYCKVEDQMPARDSNVLKDFVKHIGGIKM